MSMFLSITKFSSVYITVSEWFQPWALGLLLADGASTVHSGVGEDFLACRLGSFHENGRNSEMKSRTLDPNAHGYERPLDKKRGLFEKKKDFRDEIWIFGPKKDAHFLMETML